MSITRIAERFTTNPKTLFLIDGVGAVVSAFMLGVVLVSLEPSFGIPASSLYFLATLPLCFAIYDLYCYRRVNSGLGSYLRGIAVVNLLYCCLSMGFALYHSETLTALAWACILTEILIVAVLAMFELRVAGTLR